MTGVRKIAGEAKCPACGFAGQVKENAKGHLYFYCGHPAEGGCYCAFQPRHEKADRWLATFITKWRDDDLRARFGPKGKAGPAKAANDNPAPANDNEAHEAAPKTVEPAPASWWDKEI